VSVIPATKSISAAAERMRRHRQRRREGLRSLTIELREAEIDALIRSGFLERGSRNDANAVTEALYRVFDRIFRVTRNVSTSGWSQIP
jgi:SOS response regulatory protein OraA/RecX